MCYDLCDSNHTMNNIVNLLTLKERQLVSFKSFKKGTVIYRENELCSSIGIIIKGQVDIVSYSFEGNELIYNSLTDGEIFGNNLVFSTTPKYKGDVIAKKDSEIALISANNLLLLLQSNKPFLNEYLKIQSDFGKKLNAQIKLLSYDNAEERFNYYMYLNEGHIEYSTVTELATTLHIKRETLSRLLTSLEKRRLIRRINKHIYLLDN